MNKKEKNVSDYFMEGYEQDQEGDVALETAKFILDKIVTSDEFKDLVLKEAMQETDSEELAETVYLTLIKEVWPRIATDLPRLV